MSVRTWCWATVTAGVVLLSGCSSSGTGSGGSASGLATLTVHIGLFGGPMRPSGGMALSDSPASNENATAVDAAGHETVALTGADGVATMRLTPGSYTVYSTYCGTGPRRIVLAAGGRMRVQIDCPVP